MPLSKNSRIVVGTYLKHEKHYIIVNVKKYADVFPFREIKKINFLQCKKNIKNVIFTVKVKNYLHHLIVFLMYFECLFKC